MQLLIRLNGRKRQRRLVRLFSAAALKIASRKTT
jgi:hypothetical protein